MSPPYKTNETARYSSKTKSTIYKKNLSEINTEHSKPEKPIMDDKDSEDNIGDLEENTVDFFDVSLDTDLQNYIFDLCETRNVDPAIVVAMIDKESKFDSAAVGDGGNSLGLMQIQPRWNSARMNELNCSDLLDPYQNVTVGIDILGDYIDQKGSIEWALMAYNGGPSYANNMWSSGQLSEYASYVLNYANNI